jgi:transposase-like protein
MDSGSSFVGELIVRVLQRFVTEALEQEVMDFLGRGYYERGEARRSGYRNGYETSRLKTAEGPIPVERPQVRDAEEPYTSALWRLLKQRTPALEKLAIEAFARGLSTRDIEELFRDEEGRTLISKDGVCDLTEQLWEEYKAFSERDLSNFQIEYLFVDAVYESMRERAGLKEGILVAWAITRSGARVLIHLALGNKESYDSWLEFLRDLVKRGLKPPILYTTDGAPGLIKAAEEIFPHALRQRCIAHKKRNILSKIPDAEQAEVRACLDEVWYASTYEQGKRAAQAFIETFENLYPSAVRSFKDDLDASLQHLKCPVKHRKAIRTTNLLERAFGEQRRRTKVIPRFFNEKSCLKLTFAALIRASDSWNKVPMTIKEQTELIKLREELYKPKDPTPTVKTSQVA